MIGIIFNLFYDPAAILYDIDWVDTMFKKNAKTESYSLCIPEIGHFHIRHLLGLLESEGIVVVPMSPTMNAIIPGQLRT
jgi:hypothetical protein